MIFDMGPIIAQYGHTYVVKSNSSFTYHGITYNDGSTIRSFVGMLQSLGDEERQRLIDLGFAVGGLKVFYAGSAQGKLATNDIVVDEDGVEWVVLPEEKYGNSNYARDGGYVKYILSRRIIE